MPAVVIHCRYRVSPAIRDEWLESARRHTIQSRAEPGCLGFAFSFDAWEPEIAYVYEKWESWETMNAHRFAPHHHQRKAELKGMEGIEYQEIKFYVVGEEIDMLEAARPR